MSAMHELGLGRFFAVVTAALTLAACSGGGSSAPNEIVKTVTLNGAQENPAVTTAATGSGFISVNATTGAVTGRVTTFGLTANVAHIHQGAVGVNTPVIVNFTQIAPGVWEPEPGGTMTAAQIEAFRNGQQYFNVHTTAFPGGEIRGQIGRQVWYATLTGAQEVPPTSSTATGTGTFVLDPDTRTMSGTVVTTGVVGVMGHIHIAPIGSNAPVAIDFTGGPSTWTMPPTVLTEAQLTSLLAGSFYANIHSAAIPTGEIRGQLYLPAKMANLTGAQETPPNASAGTGTGRFMVNPVTRAIAGRLDWNGVIATDAHIHNAAPGVAGGIVIRGTVVTGDPGSLTISSTTPLADNLFAAFMQGNLYYNVHSAAFPPGEIRGQLVSGQ